MRLLGLGVLAAVAAVVATAAFGGRGDGSPGGRGDGLPEARGDAVANVGGSVITKSEFDRAVDRAPREGRMGTAALRGVPYDPPDHEACVGAKMDSPVPVGGAKPTDESLREDCRAEFEGLLPVVMENLIEAEWIRQEAKRRGIRFSAADAEREVESYLKREGSTEQQAYRDYLEQSGLSKREFLADIQLDLVRDALFRKVATRASKSSAGRLRENNARGRRQPERRDLLVVLARTKGEADEARRALERGASWRDTAQRYSIDASSRARGARLPGVTRGEYEEELERAAFDAKRGELAGPVETQFGWYVIEVAKIRAARPESPEQAGRSVRRERERTALNKFAEWLRETYRARTWCADGFEIPECANG
jgi:foldase protein PrsA